MLTRHPAMPQFRFTTREIDDIIAYLNSVQPRQTVLLSPPNRSQAPLG
jgi:hypothetical protein